MSWRYSLGKAAAFHAGRVARWFGYDVVPVRRKIRADGLPYAAVYPVATYSPWVADDAFNAVYERIRPYTMVDRFRLYELWELTAQAEKLGGAIVEVGVRKGGSGCLIAERLQASGSLDPVYLCDTFHGIAKAGVRDPHFKGGEYADATAEAVRALATSLKLDNVHVLEGVFPEQSGHLVRSPRIAMCHVDVDVYESARGVLDWLEGRLVDGGIVVFDDYGFRGTVGITEYVNELKSSPKWLVIHNLNGHGILVRRPMPSA